MSQGWDEQAAAASDAGDLDTLVTVLEAVDDEQARGQLVDALVRRAERHDGAGQRGAQLADLDRACALAPDALAPRRERIHALLREGRVDEAIADAAHNHRLAPGPATASFLARALLQGRRYDEALAAIDASLEGDPTDGDEHRIRSIILREMGRIEEALLAAHRAMAFRPDDRRGMRTRALALEAMDEPRAAFQERLRARSD